MKTKETIRPGRFLWRRSGRRWVAEIGGLKASVAITNRVAGMERVWYVREVFGVNQWTRKEHRLVEDAMLEAERLAIRMAQKLTAAITS